MEDLTPTELCDQLKHSLPNRWDDPEFLCFYGGLCRRIERVDDARRAFLRVLELDKDFTSFEDIDERVCASAARKEPIEMSLASRRAMVHLGCIDEDDDAVLNSAYSANDPEVLITAGMYFLGILDADVDYAVGLFIKATKGMPVDSPLVKT